MRVNLAAPAARRLRPDFDCAESATPAGGIAQARCHGLVGSSALRRGLDQTGDGIASVSVGLGSGGTNSTSGWWEALGRAGACH